MIGTSALPPFSPAASAPVGYSPVGKPARLAGNVPEGENAGPGANSFQLSDAEQKQVDALKKRDREVRQHEQAHKAAGGQYTGAISYEYQEGPDGKSYVVGGEVPIDASEIPGDPAATIEKMRVVKAAALAPAEPSGQDRKVAAQADAMAAKARAELNKEQAAGPNTPKDPNAPGGPIEGSLAQQLAEMRERDKVSDDEVATVFSPPSEGLAAYAAAAYGRQAGAKA